ncbi:MAG: radical SAM protein [Chitinivibrionales bacterium]|nr:radical SAM protein [Chitinivibrionales bacterium]
MRVLLINPPRSPHNAILAHAPAEAKRFIHKKLIGPPLGLLTVAAAVRDHDVELLEMKGEYDLDPHAPTVEQMVRRAVEVHRPHVVGVTVIASEYPASMRILKEVKRVEPKTLTVVGGLHATLCPRDFERDEVDVVCPGQSAHTFRRLVDTMERGEGIERLDGIYVNGPGGLRYTRDPESMVDAAGMHFLMPDRSLLRRWISTYRVGGASYPVTYLFTSLGCPYRCSFCSIWPQFCGRYYQRDVESVIQELQSIDEYRIVRFADANTIVNLQFVNRLFDRIAQEGISKEYVMDMRADTAARNPRLVEKLARGGLKVVICGFESFRERDLARYNKSTDARLIKKAIDVFHANGISVRGNYVVPPDYDADDFAALREYAGANRVTFAGYTILTPMPGTQLFIDMIHEIEDFDLAKYNFFNCVLRTKLPRERFYECMAGLWPIKKGLEVI